MTWEQGQDRTTMRRHVTDMAQQGGWERLDPIVLQRGGQVMVLLDHDVVAPTVGTIEVHRYGPKDWNELVRRLR